MHLATSPRRDSRLRPRVVWAFWLVLAAPGWSAGCADPEAHPGATVTTDGHDVIVFGTSGDVRVATTVADTGTRAADSGPDSEPGATDSTTVVDTAGASEDTAVATDATMADVEVAAETASGCGEQTLALTQVAPASVLLVVDRSNSMKGAKWADAKAAIGEIATAYEATLRLGLLMFPQAKGDCSVSPVADSPIALSNAEGITTTLAEAELFLSTPTASAVVAAGQLLATADHAAPRVIVLATDGQPTCPTTCGTCTAAANGGCFAGSCDLCIDVHACIAHQLTDTVDALAGEGILTYVVGLPGSEEAADTLNAVADAGGTALPGATRYYRADDAATLATTLGTIAGTVASCSAPVTPAGGSNLAIVRIDGSEVVRDSSHHDGWDLLDGNLVQFYGPACTAASAPGADVSITWTCKGG